MSSSIKVVKILIDADVLIHLFKADKISILNALFPNRLFMLDIVLNELRKNRTIQAYLDMIFRLSGIKEIQFSTTENPSMFSEYLSLSSQIPGEGERASLLFCKHNRDIIASSNTSDIKNFCNSNGIAYLTTLDILCIAIERGELTAQEVNILINKITSQKSHLCCNSVEEHLNHHFDKLKLLY